MRLKNQIFLFFLCFLLTLLLAPAVAASDSDDDDDLIVAGDNILSNTTKGGFAVSGADMAIDDCLATFSWLFGLRQDAKINLDCEAMREAQRLDAEGQHGQAAEMRCSTKLYRKRLGRGQKCIDKVILNNPKPPEFVSIELDERFLAQQIELDSMRGELALTRGELAAVVELVEQQRQVVTRAATRAASRTPPPKYSDTDRLRVKAILAGEAPDE